MSIVPIIHIGSAFGIMALLAMAMDSWFFSQSLLLPSKNIWEDAYKIIHKDTELEFQTSGDFEWSTGVQWNMTIKAKLPCTHGEEMVDEFTQADEEKTFKLLDQIHSAILLKERERIIGSEHALGHLLRFENSDVFFSEEIDFKKFNEVISIEGPNTVEVSNGTIVIKTGTRLILRLKISQGKLKLQDLNEAKSFELFRRVDKNNTTALPEQIDGISIEPEYDDAEELYWLFHSDTAQFNPSEINYLKSQLKTGVFISLKVIGSESSEKRIGYTLKKLSGSRENCTYKFSSNLHIDSQSLVRINGNSKPMVIRIPRDHAENGNGKLNYPCPWYNLMAFFRLLFSSPSQSPRNVNFCLTYENGIKGDVDILLPKAIVSFLICY